MPIYSRGASSTNGTIDQTVHGLITAASKRALLLEVGLSLQVTSTPSKVYSLGFPAANGVTPTSPQLLQAENPGDPACVTTSAVAWTTSPTNPTNALRRCCMGGGAGNGAGFVFGFPRGIWIPVSSNFVIQNLGTTGVTTIASYFVIEE